MIPHTSYLTLYGIESLHCCHHQYVGEGRKRLVVRRMDDRKAMSAIFYVLCHWLSVECTSSPALAHQVQVMTDSKNGERLVFSSKCGSDGLAMYNEKLGIRSGNGRLWMVLLQKHLSKKHRPNTQTELKSGTKPQFLVDGKGYHLVYVWMWSNRHDMKMDQSNTTKHRHL